jgi:hypothetical protein
MFAATIVSQRTQSRALISEEGCLSCISNISLKVSDRFLAAIWALKCTDNVSVDNFLHMDG